jgi:hypothetical protein
MAARGSTLVLALLAAGCAPRLVWLGRSDDRRHVVLVLESEGKQRVRLDGRDGPELLGVGVEGLVLGADGRHLAYPARRAGGWTMIQDGREGPLWDGIGAVTASPDGAHLAYTAERAGRWHVVHDGRVGPAADAILDGSLVLSAGGRLLYAVERAGRAHAMIDGVEGPAYDGIGGLGISADGARAAYVARRGDEALAVVDGTETRPYEAVAEVALAPRRGRVAVVARREGKWRAVVDGVEGSPFDRVSRVRWSPTGDRVAYAAKLGGREVVVLDGAVQESSEGAPPPANRGPFEAVMPSSLAFDASGAHFAFSARRDGKWRVTADGREGPPYDEVEPPVWSPGGALGYIARRGFLALAVIDGREGAEWAWATDLVLGAGGRFAYLAGHGDHSFVVDDRGQTPYALLVSGTLGFSRDGTRWGCVAGDPRSRRLFVAVEGGARRPVDGEELVAAVAKLPVERRLAQRADEGILRQWVAAELALVSGLPPRPAHVGSQ